MYLPEYTRCCLEDGHDWQKHVGTNFYISLILYFIIYCAKFYQLHAMQVHRRSRGTALTSFNLSARWSWWVISRSGRFTPGKQPCYLLHKKLGSRKGQSGLVVITEKNLLPPMGLEPRSF